MTQQPIFIAIEGVDGVGKSTCAKLLAKKLKAINYKTPSGVFEITRDNVERLGNDLVRFNFYLTAVLWASSEIQQLIHQEKSVVCDRYIYSTIAYHQALGVDLTFINFSRLPLLWPDFCFYLHADEEIRRERIKGRGIESSSDVRLEKDVELQRRIHQQFMKLQIIKIDCSFLTPEQTCSEMMRYIFQGC